MNTISFPGLGIGPTKINPSFIKTFFPDSEFFLDIKWYAVIITFGMILAFFYARSRAKYEGISDDDIYDVTLWCIIAGIVGARLYYVAFQFESYLVTDGDFWYNLKETFLNIINIREGGLAIYGGIIVGVLTGYLIARKKRIRFATLADVAAPAIMIGQIVGRWGNFFNAEAYGTETTLPWRMGLMDRYGEWSYVHPTFLYESLWNLAGFVLIAVFYKKKKYNGQVFLFYAAWYGLGRSFIEGLRTDSLMGGSIRVSQIVGILSFLVGAALFFLFWKKTPASMKLIPAVAEAKADSVAEKAEESCDDTASETEEVSGDASETEICESETHDGETD